MDEVAITDETAITNQTEFEKLLGKIAVERETARNSELVVVRQREILKTISSVYFFLRRGLKMPFRSITLEEFEISQQRLRLIAEEEVKKFWPRFWSAFGKKTWWHHYLKFGYFDNSRKNTKVGFWSGYPYQYDDRFSVDEALKAKDSECVSPNLKELMEEMYKKKYGSLPE